MWSMRVLSSQTGCFRGNSALRCCSHREAEWLAEKWTIRQSHRVPLALPVHVVQSSGETGTGKASGTLFFQ